MRLLDLSDDIVVFDIDGTLSKYDFRELNAKIFNPHEWVEQNMLRNVYDFCQRTHLFDELIDNKYPSDLYVLSVTMSSFEQSNKIEFISKNYSKIPFSNIMFVSNDEYKVDVLKNLRRVVDSSGYSHKKIIMIEDSVKVMESVENLKDERIRCYLLSDFI